MRAVLTYHSIDESGSAISVHPDDFRRHIRWLGEHATWVVPLHAIPDSSERDAIAITFDDGFLNFEQIALPLLREYKLPATLFVVSHHVGGTNSWRGTGRQTRIPTLPLLGWPGIARAASEGIEIGSHTQTHPVLGLLDPAELAREVRDSRADIVRELAITPSSFCYPYGDTNTDVQRAVADAGYSIAVTTELAAAQAGVDDPLLIPRIDAYYLRQAGLLESWGTPSFSRRLMLRRTGRRLRNAVAGAVGRWRG